MALHDTQSKCPVRWVAKLVTTSFILLNALALPIALADGLDNYHQFSKSDGAKLSRETGYNANYWWSHYDRLDGNKAAPFIFLEIESKNDGDDVGSYRLLSKLMASKSYAERNEAFAEAIKAGVDDPAIKAVRVRGVELVDEVSMVMVIVDLISYDDSVTNHIRTQIWSQDDTRRCKATAEVSGAALNDYYTNIFKALGQLVDYCSAEFEH